MDYCCFKSPIRPFAEDNLGSLINRGGNQNCCFKTPISAWTEGEPIPETDADADAFLLAANITDATIKASINTMVVDMKANGIWDKMKAIYPFVGGTATTHKFNLKDPRDLDAAFRLQFFGGWTHSKNGALGNGANTYADTFFIPNSELTHGSTAFSFYSRTNSDGAKLDLGVNTQLNNNFLGLYSRIGGNLSLDLGCFACGGRFNATAPNSLGFVVASRTTTSLLKVFKNGSQIGSNQTTTSIGLPNKKLYIGAANHDGSLMQPSDRENAFTSIGDGLTDTDASNLNTIVNNFQVALSRNV